jgi:hypothetical protein
MTSIPIARARPVSAISNLDFLSRARTIDQNFTFAIALLQQWRRDPS